MNGEQYPNWTIQFQEKLGHECGRSAGFVLPGGREHALRLVVSKKRTLEQEQHSLRELYRKSISCNNSFTMNSN